MKEIIFRDYKEPESFYLIFTIGTSKVIKVESSFGSPIRQTNYPLSGKVLCLPVDKTTVSNAEEFSGKIPNPDNMPFCNLILNGNDLFIFTRGQIEQINNIENMFSSCEICTPLIVCKEHIKQELQF